MSGQILPDVATFASDLLKNLTGDQLKLVRELSEIVRDATAEQMAELRKVVDNVKSAHTYRENFDNNSHDKNGALP